MTRPWENEPDRKEWTAYGLKCVVRRHRFGKQLNGYVGLPPQHPKHGCDAHSFADFDVHGGVTWAGELPLELIDGDDCWWVGFHTNHAYDLAPYMVDASPPYPPSLLRNCVYRDLAYVSEQTENLARQLAEVKA